jgi:catechol 2,3-dioxygenase-like lactoylglutathione lyase family enzyme
MAVKGLDHINIVTSDIDGTKQFYRELLGLVDGDTSGMPPGVQAHWLADPTGRSIIHLQRYRPERHGPDEALGPTGAIDHVALDCEDYDATVARCAKLGVACREGIAGANFRQLFVTDPNGIRLELNFRG